jgi:hypothetical protein
MDAACATEALVSIHQNTRHIVLSCVEGVLESGGTDPQITCAVRDGLWPIFPPESRVPAG